MEVFLFLAPFVVLGAIVLFIAFSGGPGRARQAYLSRGGRGARVAFFLVYAALGIGIPALVIAGRDESVGATGGLASAEIDPELAEGKSLFSENCKSCHTLAAANARGVTGPNLDELAPLDEERVVNAIDTGGTGEGRMPADIVAGDDAELVAAYVARVAGR